MQDNDNEHQHHLNIQDHPLWYLVRDMVYNPDNPDKTEAYNDEATEQWLTGEKDYFNGLAPVDLYDTDEDGAKEVVEYINYNIIKHSKECILEAQSWEEWV